jgi:hypothetical protein
MADSHFIVTVTSKLLSSKMHQHRGCDVDLSCPFIYLCTADALYLYHLPAVVTREAVCRPVLAAVVLKNVEPIFRGRAPAPDEREQSGETSLVESEEMCVSVEAERMRDAGTPWSEQS